MCSVNSSASCPCSVVTNGTFFTRPRMKCAAADPIQLRDAEVNLPLILVRKALHVRQGGEKSGVIIPGTRPLIL